MTHSSVPSKIFKCDGTIYQINLLKISPNILRVNVISFVSNEVRSYYIKSKLKGVGYTSKVFLRRKRFKVEEEYEWGIGEREKEVILFEVRTVIIYFISRGFIPLLRVVVLFFF